MRLGRVGRRRLLRGRRPGRHPRDRLAFYSGGDAAATAAAGEEERAQCALLRDIFGNPFRPVTFNPTWRTPAVAALARSLYEEGRFEYVSVLGDALEEAGCTDEQILAHCRRPGPHVKGCWVIDLVRAVE